jgi:hypothetical protein
METEERPWHGHNQSLMLTLPPLGAVLFKARKPVAVPAVDAEGGDAGVKVGVESGVDGGMNI